MRRGFGFDLGVELCIGARELDYNMTGLSVLMPLPNTNHEYPIDISGILTYLPMPHFGELLCGPFHYALTPRPG
jgi:hypothetical protein